MTTEQTTATIRNLKSKAHRLRRDAVDSLAPLAKALKRRACELEFEAFLLEQRLADRVAA